MSSNQRKQEILSVALSCFSTQGVEATSIEQISQLSHASVGSIYHHFKNKEGIAAALYLEGIRAFNHYLTEKTCSYTDLHRFIDNCIDANIEWVINNHQWAQYIFQHSHVLKKSHEHIDVLQHQNKAMFEALLKGLNNCKDISKLDKYPPALYLPLILGPLHYYVKNWLEGTAISSPIEYQELFKNLAKTFLAHPQLPS